MDWNTDILKGLTKSIVNKDFSTYGGTVNRGDYFWKNGEIIAALYDGASADSQFEHGMSITELLERPIVYLKTQSDFTHYIKTARPNKGDIIIFGKGSFNVDLSYLRDVEPCFIYFVDTTIITSGYYERTGNSTLISGYVRMDGNGFFRNCKIYNGVLNSQYSHETNFKQCDFFSCSISGTRSYEFSSNSNFYSCNINLTSTNGLAQFTTCNFNNCNIVAGGDGRRKFGDNNCTYNSCYISGGSASSTTSSSNAIQGKLYNCRIDFSYTGTVSPNASFINASEIKNCTFNFTRSSSNVPSDGYPIVLSDDIINSCFTVDKDETNLRFVESKNMCINCSIASGAGNPGILATLKNGFNNCFSSASGSEIRGDSSGKFVGNILDNISISSSWPFGTSHDNANV